MHRLDKGTTGLMLAAKDERTLTGLAAQFKAHTVQRVYHAIVLGVPKQAEGVIETNIGRDIRDRKKMGVFPYMSSRQGCFLLLRSSCKYACMDITSRTRHGHTLRNM